MEEDDAVIWVCQGPPFCSLEGDEAVARQQSGCPVCKKIIMHADGSETEHNGGTA